MNLKIRCEHLQEIYEQFNINHGRILSNCTMMENPDITLERAIGNDTDDKY